MIDNDLNLSTLDIQEALREAGFNDYKVITIKTEEHDRSFDERNIMRGFDRARKGDKVLPFSDEKETLIY